MGYSWDVQLLSSLGAQPEFPLQCLYFSIEMSQKLAQADKAE